MTVYLSGKITGLPKNVYTANFAKAERFYKGCGFSVINPVTIGEALLKRNPKAEYEDFMKEDIKALKDCTHLALLDGWEDSNGANR